MRCPRCSAELFEREREGVTIDVCRDCRGIWLDRGELEKLMARERHDSDDYYKDYERYRAAQPRGHYGDRYYKDGKYKRPKTWVEALGDLFD